MALPQKTLIAPAHQHDGHGVRAGEVVRAAGVAMALVPTLLHHRGSAAGAAETVRAMPTHLSPRLSENARVGLGQSHGRAPGLLKGQPFRQGKLVMGIGDLGDIEGKAGPILVVEAEE